MTLSGYLYNWEGYPPDEAIPGYLRCPERLLTPRQVRAKGWWVYEVTDWIHREKAFHGYADDCGRGIIGLHQHHLVVDGFGSPYEDQTGGKRNVHLWGKKFLEELVERGARIIWLHFTQDDEQAFWYWLPVGEITTLRYRDYKHKGYLVPISDWKGGTNGRQDASV